MPKHRLTINDVVELTHLSAPTIRVLMRTETFGWSTVHRDGRGRKTRTEYYFVPQKIADYLSVPVEQITHH